MVEKRRVICWERPALMILLFVIALILSLIKKMFDLSDNINNYIIGLFILVFFYPSAISLYKAIVLKGSDINPFLSETEELYPKRFSMKRLANSIIPTIIGFILLYLFFLFMSIRK